MTGVSPQTCPVFVRQVFPSSVMVPTAVLRPEFVAGLVHGIARSVFSRGAQTQSPPGFSSGATLQAQPKAPVAGAYSPSRGRKIPSATAVHPCDGCACRHVVPASMRLQSWRPLRTAMKRTGRGEISPGVPYSRVLLIRMTVMSLPVPIQGRTACSVHVESPPPVPGNGIGASHVIHPS